jgi:hypothetical protein
MHTLKDFKKSVREQAWVLLGVAIGSLVAWALLQRDVNVFGPFVVFLVPAGGYVSKLIIRLMN